MYEADRFQIGVVHGMRIARAAITPAASDCTLVDVSATPKRLLAGAGAARWLEAHGVVAPRAVMQWQRLGGDGAVVRVHRDRYLVVADAASAAPAAVFAAAPGPHADVLVLDHEAAEFALLGGTAAGVLAELCPLDLAGMSDTTWTATRLARCELALRRLDVDAMHFRLLCTPADAQYLFGTLRDCVEVRGGSILGFDDYVVPVREIA